MANISSPIVTRFGSKQLWHKHWYTDLNSHYSTILNSIKVIENLLEVYLNYGLDFTSNPLIRDYWVNSKFKGFSPLNNRWRWFRKMFYRNARVKFEYSYVIRRHSGEYFPFKLWVLRFSGWFIFLKSSFKPMKFKVRKLRRSNFRLSKIASNLKGFSKVQNFSRVKLTIYMYLKFVSRLESNYSF